MLPTVRHLRDRDEALPGSYLVQQVFRAFSHRNFRLFFFGQGISQIGTWLQLIAVSWLVYRLSGSAFLLGLAAFALQLPFLLLTPFAGVIVDRLDRRRVLLTTNSIAATQAIVLFVLAGTGRIEVWHLIAANFVLGSVNAFDAPARQSLLVLLVGGRQDLPNAIAFNSTMMNSARFVGPMLGGAVIGAFGEPWGFALNGLSYLAMLFAIRRISVALPAGAREEGSLLDRLGTGIRFAYGFAPTRNALLLLSAVSVGISPYQSLMPWFAQELYGGGSATLGQLLSAAGLGAVSGMLYLASRSTIRGLLGFIAWAAAVAGVALLGFAACRTLWLAFVLVYCIGGGLMLVAASSNTVLQSIVPDGLRARVASLYVMAFLGASPFGSLLAGWLGDRFGPPVALAAGGIFVLIATALYARQLPAVRLQMRPVYEQMGIAPKAEDRPRRSL